MDQSYIFAIISSVIGLSFFFSGFLMDRFGRKKIIVLKIIGALFLLTILIVLGLIGAIAKSAVLAVYFLTLAFTTFSFDIICLGFESLAKENRDNFVILYSGTRNLGIGVVCILFYYIDEWAYSIIVMATLLLLLLPFFMKFVLESSHHVLASTGNIDQLRHVINSIA